MPPAKPRSSGAGSSGADSPETPKSPKKKVKMKGGVKVTIEALDKDGDGQIDLAEYLASGGTEEHFQALDADGSGKIDASELKQAAAAAEAAHGLLESPDAPTTPPAAINTTSEIVAGGSPELQLRGSGWRNKLAKRSSEAALKPSGVQSLLLIALHELSATL